MRDLTKCPGCGQKIGRLNATGTLRYDAQMMRQLSLVFGYKGTDKKTNVHVPVCKSCVENCTDEIAAKIIEKLRKYDKSFRRHIVNHMLKPEFEGTVQDQLPFGE